MKTDNFSYSITVNYVKNSKGEESKNSIIDKQIGDNRYIILSDGIGYGLKASITATITSRIIAKMLDCGERIDLAIETVVEGIDKQKEIIEQPTFLILEISKNGKFKLYQFNMPTPIFMRRAKEVKFEKSTLKIKGFNIDYTYGFVQLSDNIIICSKGVFFNKASGEKTLWNREQMINFLCASYTPNQKCEKINSLLVAAYVSIHNNQIVDDTSIVTIKVVKEENGNYELQDDKTKNT